MLGSVIQPLFVFQLSGFAQYLILRKSLTFLIIAAYLN